MRTKKKVERTCIVCGRVDVVSYKRFLPDKCRECAINARKTIRYTPVYDYDKPADEVEIQSIDNDNVVIIARQSDAETSIRHYRSTVDKALSSLSRAVSYTICAETYSKVKQPPRNITINRNTVITGL